MSDNGGPVFGHITSEYDDHRHEYRLSSTVQGELTLRDYFAAKAMQGIRADEAFGLRNDPDQVADRAYALADAMLKARQP
jgi:hypothetical protein